MLTFFNDPQLKAALLARLEGHRLADEIDASTGKTPRAALLAAPFMGITL